MKGIKKKKKRRRRRRRKKERNLRPGIKFPGKKQVENSKIAIPEFRQN